MSSCRKSCCHTLLISDCIFRHKRKYGLFAEREKSKKITRHVNFPVDALNSINWQYNNGIQTAALGEDVRWCCIQRKRLSDVTLKCFLAYNWMRFSRPLGYEKIETTSVTIFYTFSLIYLFFSHKVFRTFRAFFLSEAYYSRCMNAILSVFFPKSNIFRTGKII